MKSLEVEGGNGLDGESPEGPPGAAHGAGSQARAAAEWTRPPPHLLPVLPPTPPPSKSSQVFPALVTLGPRDVCVCYEVTPPQRRSRTR